MPAHERYAWRALAYPFVAFFVLFPVGTFLGAVTNLAVVVCKGNLEGSGCGAMDPYRDAWRQHGSGAWFVSSCC